MIVTLTANPSLDRTVTLAGPLVPGEVHRARQVVTQPGGKGVNVARVLTAAGRQCVAVLPADRHDPLTESLRALGLAHRAVPLGDSVRTNLALTDPDGVTTKVNQPGPRMKAVTVEGLRETLVTEARGAAWVVLSGSLPPFAADAGVGEDWYADLVLALRELDCRIAVDTSDDALLALAARWPASAPDLIKPNSEELAQLAGVDPAGLEAAAAGGDFTPVVRACERLRDKGVREVMATLGRHGAVLVTAAGAWTAQAPPVRVRSTVGAGDSSLAGYLLADLDGARPHEKLCYAIAYGSAAAARPGTELPGPEDADPSAVTARSVRMTLQDNREAPAPR